MYEKSNLQNKILFKEAFLSCGKYSNFQSDSFHDNSKTSNF